MGADTRTPLVSGRSEDCDAADLFEIVEKPLHAVRVSGDLFGFAVEQPSEEIAEDASEDVDVELLVGPMELGTESNVGGILEVSEDSFDDSLPAVGADDIGRGPIVAIGDEDDTSQGFGFES